jgi:hypothetical protein
MTSNPQMHQVRTECEPFESRPPLYFVVTFWGQQYREWFCRYPLASLLSPNNIPSLKKLGDCRFLICTTKKDWNALQRELLFQHLTQLIEPQFIWLPAASANQFKYHRMSLGHNLLTTACFNAGAAAIYISSDAVIPDGCIAEAERFIEEGKRVVLCTAIRFEMEGVENELVARGIRKPNKPLTITRREAVQIGLRNVHSESRAGNWEAPFFGELNAAHRQNQFPTCCYWSVPKEEGIVIFTHNWAPFVINFSGLSEHDTTSFERWAIDGDYIYRNFKTAKRDDIYVVEDSDKIIILGLTPRSEMVTPTPNYFWQRWPTVGFWSKGFILNRALFGPHIDALRQRIYCIPVRWHSRDLSVAWAAAEARAQSILDEFKRRDLRPWQTVIGLTSAWEVLRFVRSVEFPRLLWITTIFYVLLPVRQVALNSTLRLSEYLRVIFLALSGNPMERARISKRVKVMLSAASLKRS